MWVIKSFDLCCFDCIFCRWLQSIKSLLSINLLYQFNLFFCLLHAFEVLKVVFFELINADLLHNVIIDLTFSISLWPREKFLFSLLVVRVFAHIWQLGYLLWQQLHHFRVRSIGLWRCSLFLQFISIGTLPIQIIIAYSFSFQVVKGTQSLSNLLLTVIVDNGIWNMLLIRSFVFLNTRLGGLQRGCLLWNELFQCALVKVLLRCDLSSNAPAQTVYQLLGFLTWLAHFMNLILLLA